MTATPSSELADIRPGATIRALHVVDEVQMFFFSAATNNGHRIHYDLPYATQVEGLAGLLVHGPLQAALFEKLLTDWLGPGGRLCRLEIQHRAAVHPHEDLRFEATVTAVEPWQDRLVVDLDLRGTKDAGLATFIKGSARVERPSAPRPQPR